MVLTLFLQIKNVRKELMDVDVFFKLSYNGFIEKRDFARGAMARKCSAVVYFHSSNIQKSSIKELRTSMKTLDKPAGLGAVEMAEKLKLLNSIEEAVLQHANDSLQAYSLWDESVDQEQKALDANQHVQLQLSVRECQKMSLDTLEERILQAATLPNSPGETGSEERCSTSTVPKEQVVVPAQRERGSARASPRERASASMEAEPSKEREVERKKPRIEDLEQAERERDRQKEAARRDKNEQERAKKLQEFERKREAHKEQAQNSDRDPRLQFNRGQPRPGRERDDRDRDNRGRGGNMHMHGRDRPRHEPRREPAQNRSKGHAGPRGASDRGASADRRGSPRDPRRTAVSEDPKESKGSGLPDSKAGMEPREGANKCVGSTSSEGTGVTKMTQEAGGEGQDDGTIEDGQVLSCEVVEQVCLVVRS